MDASHIFFCRFCSPQLWNAWGYLLVQCIVPCRFSKQPGYVWELSAHLKLQQAQFRHGNLICFRTHLKCPSTVKGQPQPSEERMHCSCFGDPQGCQTMPNQPYLMVKAPSLPIGWTLVWPQGFGGDRQAIFWSGTPKIAADLKIALCCSWVRCHGWPSSLRPWENVRTNSEETFCQNQAETHHLLRLVQLEQTVPFIGSRISNCVK